MSSSRLESAKSFASRNIHFNKHRQHTSVGCLFTCVYLWFVGMKLGNHFTRNVAIRWVLWQLNGQHAMRGEQWNRGCSFEFILSFAYEVSWRVRAERCPRHHVFHPKRKIVPRPYGSALMFCTYRSFELSVVITSVPLPIVMCACIVRAGWTAV